MPHFEKMLYDNAQILELLALAHADDADAGLQDGNLLAGSTSPYLLQHAGNPVHWRPWGPEALAEAKSRDRPILLSVGYAACHWCHVMAHESFEDPAVAALMNDLFVNVKVDREERPDVDALYMAALHAMGEQGGWPMTMFLAPDGAPFFGGTYWPPTPRWGRPSFTQVLNAVDAAWRDKRAALGEQSAGLVAHLAEQAAPPPGADLAPADLARAADALTRILDPVNGGLSGAPKFPNAPIFRFLWSESFRARMPALRGAVRALLDALCAGGIYDHLGGGFARYSTDGEWRVPHFEKMLYDNAQILELLALAYAATPTPVYAERARETFAWLMREMRVGDAFAASLDADSEGEEGRFYVWTAGEIDAVLGADAAEFAAAYDVRRGGNWEGRNVLRRLAAARRRGDRSAARREPRAAARRTRQARAAWPRRQDPRRLERADDRRAGARLGRLRRARLPRRGRGGVRVRRRQLARRDRRPAARLARRTRRARRACSTITLRWRARR